MSDFGIYLLTAALFFAMLGLIKLLSWLTLIHERGGIKQIARTTAERYVTVKPSPLMPSVESVQTAQTGQTDNTDRPVSVANQWLDRIEVDRTRTAIIEVMVYSGWSVGEVRSVIKGDNAAIGTEVAAARQKLGIEETARLLRVKDAQGEREIVMNDR